MKRNITLTAIFLCLLSNQVLADITTTGNINPVNPATWTSSTYGYIGDTADGTMKIDSGTDVISHVGYIGNESGSTGTVTVQGSGSTWNNGNVMYIGHLGEGVLNITDGGVVNNSGTCYIAHDSGSSGSATVIGSSSVWDNDQLWVGAIGVGTLNISDGGTVRSFSGKIGYTRDSTGTVIVDGTESKWEHSYSITVGSMGRGTLEIKNGGFVSNAYGFVGERDGSTGTVTVDGPDSTWNNSFALTIGYSGNGTLNIRNGGLVNVKDTLFIDQNIDGDSFINMSTSGMLALYGNADDSLSVFLDLIEGTDAIRYWDESALDWTNITSATYGLDYTLKYIEDGGELNGYTVLTVPEPATLLLISLGGLIIRRK